MRLWHALGDDRLRAAHLEGDRLYRGQHRGGADHLGRPVDVVRRAEHRPDAVQDARLHARAQPRPPSRACAHGHLVRHVRPGADDGDRRRAVHQLHQAGERQGARGERRRHHLHRQRHLHARASVLDGQQHHLRLLQPTNSGFPEAGDRRGAVHRLGGHRDAAGRGKHALLLVSFLRGLRLLGQIRAHQKSNIQRGI